MSEIKDKDLLKQLDDIKAHSEGIEIPESLAPDNMMKRIEEMKREGHFEERNTTVKENKKTKKRKKLAVMIGGVATAVTAASLALIIAGVGVFNRGERIELNNQSMFDKVKTDVDLSEDVAVLNGYDKLLNRIVVQETMRIKKGPFEQFEEWFGNFWFDDIFLEDVKNESIDSAPGYGTNGKFENSETPEYSDTNVRTEGVKEGDIVKTDGKYIYTLSEYECYAEKHYDELGDIVLTILKADGGNTEQLCSISIKDEIFKTVDGKNRITFTGSEMLVYGDKVVIVTEYSNHTIALVYDVSDRSNPVIKDRLFVEGAYDSCRMVDGYLYVFAEKRINISEIIDEECDITKEYKNMDAAELLAPNSSNGKLLDEEIFVSECERYNMYHMIATVDMNDTSKFMQVKAVLGQDGQSKIYVSNNNIYYITEVFNNFVYEEKENEQLEGIQSEIISLSYKDGVISPRATGIINGQLGDEFAADEYDGYLRIAVSTTMWKGTYEKKTVEYYNGSEWVTEDVYVKDSIYYSDYSDGSALYVLNEELAIVGSIPQLKENENVYGVRFDGDIAYIVTYRQMDPLFTIDLKDPTNPTVIGALKIPGFSTYLHKWDENTLIGIGYNDDNNIKISTFDITDKTNVLEKDVCDLDNVYYTEAILNHKAVFVSPEKNLLGFMDDFGCYRVFSYVDGVLTRVISEGFMVDYFAQSRGMYIGEYIYIVVPEVGVSVYDVDSYELVKKVQFNS